MASGEAKAGGLLLVLTLLGMVILGNNSVTEVTEQENESLTVYDITTGFPYINNTITGEVWYLSENLAPLSSWSVSGDGYTPDTWSTTVWDTVVLHEGNPSIRNEYSGPPWLNRESNLVENIPVTPGEVYIFTGYIQTDPSNLGTTTQPPQNGGRFGVDFYGDGIINGISYNPYGNLPSLPQTNGQTSENYVNWNNTWTLRTIRFKIPSLLLSQVDGLMYRPTSIKPWFGVWGSGAAYFGYESYDPELETSDVWFSDTTLTRVDDSPPDPPISPSPAEITTITYLESVGGIINATGMTYWDETPTSQIVTYLAGETVQFTAYPSVPLYSFSHWLIDNTILSPVTNPGTLLTAGTSNFTVQAVYNYTAPDVPAGADWTLTVFGSPGGSTDPAPDVYVETGASKTVNAVPSSTYRFSYWIIDSQILSEVNPYPFSSGFNESHTLEPFFTLDVRGQQSEVLIIPTGTPVLYGDTTLPELRANFGEQQELNIGEIRKILGET